MLIIMYKEKINEKVLRKIYIFSEVFQHFGMCIFLFYANDCTEPHCYLIALARSYVTLRVQ